MYLWLWRHLPGSRPVRVLTVIVLLAGLVGVLFTVVFPWAEPRLPWNEVELEQGSVVVPHQPASGAAPVDVGDEQRAPGR